MSTVVVTGAAGSLGQRVLALLVTEPDIERIVGIDVVPGAVMDPRLEYRLLDLAGPPAASLDAGLAGASAVIHLAWSEAPPAADGTNLEAMASLLEAASRAGVHHIVHLSSATVYGAWPDNPMPLAEDAAIRPNPGFVLAVEKAESERMATEWADRESEAVLAVLRPAVTVPAAGPALYRVLVGGGGTRADDGGRPMQFLHIDDLASAIVLIWRRRGQGVYNVSPAGWIGDDTARTLVGGPARLTLPGRLRRTGTPRGAWPYAVHPWVIANDRLTASGWVPAHTNEEALVSAKPSRWRDLRPGTRRGLVLVATVAAAGAAIAAGAGAARAARSRRE